MGSKRKFQAIASTMQKLESTGKQVSNRFYKYQNALQKKSLKIPKVCYDSEALILECGVYLDPPKYAMIKMHQWDCGVSGYVDFIWMSCRYENGEKEHCLELWNRDGKVGCL